jgi:ABC-type multidrug transport system fused ATPase/permease subunit
VGKSGAGKSTLVDMIAGLYSPDSGSIKLDGEKISDKNIQSWRTKIGYIPQQVYLFDGTVAENVCFGKEINKSKLEDVLKKANIFDFLQAKKGLQTRVGEGGVQLSGGQKQRIAIARALYGDPEVMILDEATSALDNETEKKIMEEMYKISKEKTLIIIAHRLSTIQGCDVIYEVSDGQILDSK